MLKQNLFSLEMYFNNFIMHDLYLFEHGLMFCGTIITVLIHAAYAPKHYRNKLISFEARFNYQFMHATKHHILGKFPINSMTNPARNIHCFQLL